MIQGFRFAIFGDPKWMKRQDEEWMKIAYG